MRRTHPPKVKYAERLTRAQTRPHAVHEHNPSGSKLLRGFYRAKHGERETYAKSRRWYSNLR